MIPSAMRVTPPSHGMERRGPAFSNRWSACALGAAQVLPEKTGQDPAQGRSTAALRASRDSVARKDYAFVMNSHAWRVVAPTTSVKCWGSWRAGTTGTRAWAVMQTMQTTVPRAGNAVVALPTRVPQARCAAAACACVTWPSVLAAVMAASAGSAPCNHAGCGAATASPVIPRVQTVAGRTGPAVVALVIHAARAGNACRATACAVRPRARAAVTGVCVSCPPSWPADWMERSVLRVTLSVRMDVVPMESVSAVVVMSACKARRA